MVEIQMDNREWIISELDKIINDQNQVVISSAITLIQEQQSEIDSLRGAMEGRLWSPKQWNNQN